MPVILRLFLYFLYFKIASAIFLDEGFGIFACAIYAILFDAAETFSSLWIASYSNPFEGRAALRPKATRRARAIMLAGTIPLSVLVAVGFAPDSINFSSSEWLYQALNRPWQWLYSFSMIMLQPVILQTIMPRKIEDKYPFEND